MNFFSQEKDEAQVLQCPVSLGQNSDKNFDPVDPSSDSVSFSMLPDFERCCCYDAILITNASFASILPFIC